MSSYDWMLSTRTGLHLVPVPLGAGEFLTREAGEEWMHQQLSFILIGGKLDDVLGEYMSAGHADLLKKQARRYFYGT